MTRRRLFSTTSLPIKSDSYFYYMHMQNAYCIHQYTIHYYVYESNDYKRDRCICEQLITKCIGNRYYKIPQKKIKTKQTTAQNILTFKFLRSHYKQYYVKNILLLCLCRHNNIIYRGSNENVLDAVTTTVYIKIYRTDTVYRILLRVLEQLCVPILTFTACQRLHHY